MRGVLGLIGVILFIQIFLFACADNSPATGYLIRNIPADTTDCAKESDRWDSLKCYIDASIEENSIGLCEYLTSQDDQDECISALAISTNDHFMCGEINRPQVKSLCYYQIAQSLADPQICSYISEGTIKDVCLLSVGNFAEDTSFCESLSNSQNREVCSISFTLKQEGADRCLGLSDHTKDLCYRLLAERESDIDMCDEIIDDAILHTLCIEKIAMNSMDETFCDSMIDTNLKLGCHDSVLSKIAYHTSMYDSCFVESSATIYCILAKALRESDMHVCEQLKDQLDREKCYYMYFDEKYGISNIIID